MARKFEIVIVGGSITGLMCGIALKHGGHNVHIYERSADDRDSHMAGVGLGQDAEEFLRQHDRLGSSFFLECNSIQVLEKSDTPVQSVRIRRLTTTWDSLYYRLRANFDGYCSKYYPKAPNILNSDGTAVYESLVQVLDVGRDAVSNKLVVTITRNGKQETRSADFVIGADGPNSSIRSKYLPSYQREYVGTVGWRGTVPESQVSAETRRVFEQNLTQSLMHKQCCLVYMVPGDDGSLVPGERLLNFIWYTVESKQSLSQIMVDAKTGETHHTTVPAGHVRRDIWEERLERAKPLFSPAYLELVSKIRDPFVQVITEYCAPQAAFENGQVLLVGDALALLRPHTGFSGTQAAFHVMRLEEYITGKIDAHRWEDRVCRFSQLHWARSAWWGDFYLSSQPIAWLSWLRFQYYRNMSRLISWWYSDSSLERN